MQPTPLRFRPSLIILVGETGRNISEQYLNPGSLLGLVDPILHDSIGLVYFDPNAPEAVRLFSDGQLSGRQGQNRPSLQDLITVTVEDMLEVTRIYAMEDANYEVADTRPQVYIVGDSDALCMQDVLSIVRGRLQKLRINTSVCYVLSAYQARQITGPLALSAAPLHARGLGKSLGGRYLHLADFCYLYENTIAYPRSMSLNERANNYTIAEALLALVSTGLTTDPRFAQRMEMQLTADAYENFGSFSTSMIIFPRAAVLGYCSARLGIDFLQHWISDLQRGGLSPAGIKAQQRLAQAEVSAISSWLMDGPHRPGTPEADKLSWPSLSILEKPNHPLSEGELGTQRDRLRALIHHSGRLFTLFSFGTIMEEQKKQHRKAYEWTETVERQSVRARGDFSRNWSNAAYAAWNAARDRIGAEVKRTVDQLWASNENGFELARIYVDELDERLARLADDAAEQCETHENDYEDVCNTFERRATGVWNNYNLASGGGGLQQPGVIQLSIYGYAGNAPGGAIIGGAQPQQAQPPVQPFAQREERIIRGLIARIKWMQERVPPLGTLVGLGLPFLLLLVLTANTLLPSRPALAATLPFALAGIGALGALVGLGNWFYHRKLQQRVKQAQEDLLSFHRHYHAHQSTTLEDDLRNRVMSPLRSRVLRMRERLDDIQNFIAGIQAKQQDEARQINYNLFNGPEGGRDIFVANGERLQETGRNTLSHVAAQIDQERAKNTREDLRWHQNFIDMRREFIRRIRQRPQSIIEVSFDEAQQQVGQFIQEIIASQMTDKLVDIQYALDKEEVWSEALERVRSSSYRAYVGMRDYDLLFVCGREKDVDMGKRLGHVLHKAIIPENAIEITTRNEWLLMGALFRGGEPDVLNIDQLFPARSQSSPGPVNIPPAPGHGTAPPVSGNMNSPRMPGSANTQSEIV